MALGSGEGRRSTPDLSTTAGILSGGASYARPRSLLHLWAANLPLGLACGSLARRHPEQKRRMAFGLRRCLEALDGAERPGSNAQGPAAPPLLGNGKRLLRTAEVDHRVPLYRVWREHRDAPWPTLLRFWGGPNLQVVNRSVHVSKCGAEAEERALLRRWSPPMELQQGLELGKPPPGGLSAGYNRRHGDLSGTALSAQSLPKVPLRVAYYSA
jgi:hypothetical protein